MFKRFRFGSMFGGSLLGAALALLAVVGSGPADAAPAKAFHIEEATIAQIQSAILDKRITTEQVVRLYLARIKAYNGTCVKQPQGLLGPIETIPHAGQINALSTLNLRPATRKALGFDERKARSMTDAADTDPNMPDALETAIAQDREFARTGKLVGPLQGVVMAFKDQYDTFDMRSTSGADPFYANDRPPHDATFVKRLRDAGAIILAKANLAEYADGVPRSSFGGTFCNPYDTERSPNVSSAGSGSSVAANFVTCAIAEETGSSVRGPAEANNVVGMAPTQELISRDGMIQQGINTRVGPICRNVEDVAKILQVYAGYDPKDPFTVFSIGRMPAQPYPSFATAKSLKGLRIGVVREYMSKKLFTPAEAETIDIVGRAADDLRKLGADVVDPGPEGELFTACLRTYEPALDNVLFTRRFPQQFPVDDKGKPVGDHIARLLDMTMDPSLVPPDVNIRTIGQAQAIGEAKFELDWYLRKRGDANIKSNTDLVNKANYFSDPKFASQKEARANADKPMEYNTAERMLRRFAVQQLMLQCMQEQNLDALVYPTAAQPPARIGAPAIPPLNGRNSNVVWSFLGSQGFPAITVPAGFTTEVYDWVRDPSAPLPPESTGGGPTGTPREGTRMTGPFPDKMPVGVDFVGRPFAEPVLFRIASAYEAATHHRMPPPDFGPVTGEP
ncbi:amidase [Nevskia soli]|uniref:amidase n=1 Tax=Nevskia soli TaxID=418856 RepID=UPI0004A755B0|nr:amidase [Nevskia soli]